MVQAATCDVHRSSGEAKIEATMNELIFLVEEAPEGGFTARALDAPIFTEADDLESLQEQVRDAVRCHYEPGQEPKLIRLHIVKDEVIPV